MRRSLALAILLLGGCSREMEPGVEIIDDKGATYVIKAGATFELVAKNEIGEECYSSPALAKGQIYIRGAKHLFRIGE